MYTAPSGITRGLPFRPQRRPPTAPQVGSSLGYARVIIATHGSVHLVGFGFAQLGLGAQPGRIRAGVPMRSEGRCR